MLKFNPDKEHTANILKGLLRNYEKHGDFYCPCKLKKVSENVCPCVEQQTTRHCHCELYVQEKE